MALTTAQIQNAYVAFFNRPADVAGLTYWSTYAGSSADLLNTFAQSSEYKSLYSGMNNTQTVNAVYQNLFGRSPDVAGLTYWVTQLDNGKLSIGNIADAINKGAQGTDSTIITNKVTAATAFTNALDTTAEIVAYAGVNSTGLTAVKNWLAAVTDTAASLTTATGSGLTTVLSTVQANVASNGSSFTLTTAVDTVTGTASNDVITGVVDYTASAATTSANTTMNVADVIAGGAGTDILNVTVTGSATGPNAGVTLPAASISAVETINVRAVTGSGQNITADGNNFVGHTSLNSDRSSDAVIFTNVAAGAAVGQIGNATVTNGALTATYAASATAPVLNVTGGTVGTGAITINAAGATSFTINSAGAANSVGAITAPASATSTTINAETGLTTTGITAAGSTALTVKGAASTGVTPTVAGGSTSAVNIGTVSAATKTIDASGLTAGGLGVTLIAGITSFKGGQGNDTVTTAALTATVASQIDAGAGTGDQLVVAATNDVDTATEAKEYANFEILDIGAQTADVSLFTNSTISSVKIGGNGTFNKLSATQANDVTVYANASGTYNITGATTVGQLDTLTLKVNDGLAATNTITLADITTAGTETINLQATDHVTVSALTGATAMTNLNVTGAGNVSITTGALALNVNTVIDASAATGTVTITAAAGTTNGVSIKGTTSSKVNTLTGSNQADTIVGGAGADSITGGQGADTMTGGAGADTFVLLPATINTGNDTITDFTVGATGDKLDIGFLTIPATLTAVTMTASATIATNTVYTVNYGGAIGSTNFATAGATGFDLLFGAGKAFGTTVATTDDFMVIVQGTDKTVVIAVENPAATTLAAGDIDAIVTLTGVTSSDAFNIANII